MTPNSHIDQISGILRKVLAQATGRTDLAAMDTSQLLIIGQQYKQAAETAGMADPILGAISQMVARTVFSSRKYTPKFKALMKPATTWGNVVRKLAIFDKETDVDDNSDYDVREGAAVDQYQVDATNALQLNFIGQETYQIQKTIFQTQYHTCFLSAEDFGRFVAMIMTYVANKIAKIHEETARQTVSGLIAGRVAEKSKVPTSTCVVYLIDEYNAETGAALTNKTVYAPENFKPFMEWAYARISTISDLMTEYSGEFQTALSDGIVNRHTPKDKQVAYFFTDLLNQCSTRVLTNQFNQQLMQLPGFEKVNYWQSIKEGKRDQINLQHAHYLSAAGADTDGGAVTLSNVFGVIADVEALGTSPVMERTNVTPYNAKADYYNIFWKFWERHYIDFTEKSVVFLLDTAPGK